VADELPDLRPRPSLLMEEADPPMSEIVGRERGDPRRSTGASDRGPETVRSRLREKSRVRITILPRRKRLLDRFLSAAVRVFVR
jgi:hypothetical protein